MISAQGATTHERVNNSINALEKAAQNPRVSKGVRRAITDLAEHWQRYWDQARRRELVPSLAKLEKYTAWYTRGFALLPPDIRADLPDPRTIDATFGAVVDDQMKRFLDGAASAATSAEAAKKYLAEQARALADDIGKRAKEALGTIGFWAIVGVGAYLLIKRSK